MKPVAAGLLIFVVVVLIGSGFMLSYSAGLSHSTETVKQAKRDIDKAMTTCLQFSNDLTKEKLRAHRLELQLIKMGGMP